MIGRGVYRLLRQLRAMTLLCLAAIVISHPIAAGGADALNAYKSGDYEAAFEDLQQMALNGYAEAQHALATMYAGGLGVEQNHIEAARWYRQAAFRGDADSQAELAYAYYLGRGLGLDLHEAAEWAKIAAKSDNAKAQYLLGVMHLTGRGANMDSVDAYSWISLAADQGYPHAVETRDELERRLTSDELFNGRLLAEKRNKRH